MSEEKKGFDSNQDMSIAQEFFLFLRENKLWWMMPIAIILGLLILIIILGQGSGGVFVYSFF